MIDTNLGIHSLIVYKPWFDGGLWEPGVGVGVVLGASCGDDCRGSSICSWLDLLGCEFAEGGAETA